MQYYAPLPPNITPTNSFLKALDRLHGMGLLSRPFSRHLSIGACTTPLPFIVLIWTLCHSRSGVVLSQFAAAAFMLCLCLHAREVSESVKQFLDEVDSIGERISAMIDDGREEACIASRFEPQHVTDQDKEGDFTIEAQMHTVRDSFSSDEMGAADCDMRLCNSFVPNKSIVQDVGTDKPLEAPTDERNGELYASDDSRAIALLTRNVEDGQVNQVASELSNDSCTQSTGLMKLPVDSTEVLACSAGLHMDHMDLETPCESFPASSDKSTPEEFGPQDGSADATINDVSGMSDRIPAEIVKSSQSADLDNTFVDLEASSYLQEWKPNSADECLQSNEDILLSDPSTDSIAQLYQEDAKRTSQELLPISVSSSGSSVSYDSGTGDYEEARGDGLKDIVKQGVTSEGKASLATHFESPKAAGVVPVAKPPAASNSTVATANANSKRGRRHSDGFFDHVSAPLRVAQNMRRRALDLMEESHRLKESSLCVIFQHMNPDYDVHSVTGLARLDLHCQSVEHALMLTRLHLEFCRKMQAERTQIITGRGRHSVAGVPVLRPAIWKELAKHSDVIVPDNDPNPGAFTVELTRPGDDKYN